MYLKSIEKSKKFKKIKNKKMQKNLFVFHYSFAVFSTYTAEKNFFMRKPPLQSQKKAFFLFNFQSNLDRKIDKKKQGMKKKLRKFFDLNNFLKFRKIQKIKIKKYFLLS